MHSPGPWGALLGPVRTGAGGDGAQQASLGSGRFGGGAGRGGRCFPDRSVTPVRCMCQCVSASRRPTARPAMASLSMNPGVWLCMIPLDSVHLCRSVGLPGALGGGGSDRPRLGSFLSSVPCLTLPAVQPENQEEMSPCWFLAAHALEGQRSKAAVCLAHWCERGPAAPGLLLQPLSARCPGAAVAALASTEPSLCRRTRREPDGERAEQPSLGRPRTRRHLDVAGLYVGRSGGSLQG